MNDFKWSKKEKSIARAAFDKAHEKECNQIIGKLKEKSLRLSDPEAIWELHDYLIKIRKEIDDYFTLLVSFYFARNFKSFTGNNIVSTM